MMGDKKIIDEPKTAVLVPQTPGEVGELRRGNRRRRRL